jgi:hypothetical protein
MKLPNQAPPVKRGVDKLAGVTLAPGVNPSFLGNILGAVLNAVLPI